MRRPAASTGPGTAMPTPMTSLESIGEDSMSVLTASAVVAMTSWTGVAMS